MPRFYMPSSYSEKVISGLLEKVLDTILTSRERRLVTADLLELFDKFTQISVPQSTYSTLIKALINSQVSSFEDRKTLELEAELPLPNFYVDRHRITSCISKHLQRNTMIFITGGTGVGKTLAARIYARKHGGDWYIIEFRDAKPDESAQRIRKIMGELVTFSPAGIILDDLNEAEYPEVAQALAGLVVALNRRDVISIVTAYRKPSARLLSQLGIHAAPHLAITNFDESEVGELVTKAGGKTVWVKLIHMTTDFGHPQLVQAVISGLSVRSSAEDELQQFLALLQSTTEIESERSMVRRNLVAALDDGSRQLLYRVSLLSGRFSRNLALCLSELPSAIPFPGEKIDYLIGPWLDHVGRGELRISPLISNAGKEILSLKEQQEVHRTVADWFTGQAQMDVAKVNSAFFHAILGRSERALLIIADSIIASSPKEIRQLKDWLPNLLYQKIEHPIYQNNTTLSQLLRLAQLLLIAETDDIPAIKKVWGGLHKEILTEQNIREREQFEFMMYSKVLLNESMAGVIPNWIELLLCLEQLTDRIPEARNLIGNLQDAPLPSERNITLLGFLFLNQISNVRSVAELKDVFLRLNSLSINIRDKFFDDFLHIPSDFSFIVNNAWLREHTRGDIDWLAAADHYLHIAQFAIDWGYRELAICCHIARGVMFDEYGKDGKAALASLDNAMVLLGPDPLFSRARAKIHYRQKDHAKVLSLLQEVADTVAIDEPVERAFMLREAGISAAEIGHWTDAQLWFQAAMEASVSANSQRMLPMTIGLMADTALAAYKIGYHQAAIEHLVKALEALSTLDPDESIKAAYCHRVLRHAVLWMYGQTTEKNVEVDGAPPHIVPGMCSNPEPSEKIREKLLPVLDRAWYLMAEIETFYGTASVAEVNLRKRLKGQSIPAHEIIVRNAWVDDAIVHHDPIKFQFALSSWVDSIVYFYEHKSTLMSQDERDIANPKYDLIPTATPEQLQSEHIKKVRDDALLAFSMLCVFANKSEVLICLQEEMGSKKNILKVDILKTLITGKYTEKNHIIEIATVINAISLHKTQTPDQIFVAGLRLLQFISSSYFKTILMPVLVNWTKSIWSKIIKEQRFSLRLPAVTVPNIEQALFSDASGFRYVAKVLIAAYESVSIRIDSDLRKFLETVE